ncbi:hypothetical protein [Streptomyces antibioticus]|uniref:hypothetical protein n=1 Tax=Streptomyces antibioticus TaxID=1890 RepID=UPI0033BC9C18
MSGSLPRCARGHFLPATAPPGGRCRCSRSTRRPLVRDHADLWGQGRPIQYRRLTTIRLAGSYL